MLLGLASVYASVNEQFDMAAWMILWGVLLDKLDGTTARLFNASSSFGAQFDSFADFVSFGIAPAMLLLCAFGTQSTAYPFVPQGWMMAAAGVYVVAVAARLARFNIVEPPLGKDYFYGIPTTVMGAVLAAGFLTCSRYYLLDDVAVYTPFMLLGCSFGMISNILLPKLKLHRSLPLNIFLGVNVSFAYVVAPFKLFPEILFLQGMCYTTFGVFWAAIFPPSLAELVDEDSEEMSFLPVE
jgi:CDP-diacylglycerol---serine O-phosphatidyltransferase